MSSSYTACNIPLIGQSDVITIKVSSLPSGMTTDEIGNYLESQGANAEVLSATDLGSGNAEVKIVGYTTEGQFAKILLL